MLNPSYSSPQALAVDVAAHLHSLHKSYAGALFRTAFVCEPDPRFLTGCLMFQEQRRDARGVHDYRSILFEEEWIEGQDEACTRLTRLILNGRSRAGDKSTR